ncbi:hypothetical protein LZ30DRAFT_749490 [Colletotrichum cereale]|nr:hypothetical protein LZ30DRAFT_749490 [Colletotrichum cereale]
MPAARSFWWNGDNANGAMTHLLKNKYPQVKAVAWKRSQPKASGVVKAWRKDATLLYAQVIENGGGDDDDDLSGGKANEDAGAGTGDGVIVPQSSAAEDEEVGSIEGATDAIVVAPSRDMKRRTEAPGRIELPKKVRKRFVYDSESSEEEVFELCRYKAKPTASTPKRAVAAMITPPQSGGSTPVILVDSGTEDEGPIAAKGYYGRRRGRRGRRHRRVEPESPAADAAAAGPAPLTLTLVRTMASIEPAKAPAHKHECLAALQEAMDSVAKSRVAFSTQKRRKASRQLNKLEDKLEKLSSAVKRLNDAGQP